VGCLSSVLFLWLLCEREMVGYHVRISFKFGKIDVSLFKLSLGRKLARKSINKMSSDEQSLNGCLGGFTNVYILKRGTSVSATSSVASATQLSV
jgi:hypothetical protein